MDVKTIEKSGRSPRRKAPSNAAIVFGSAASHPGRKPASVRATCEAIGLPRSTYYYQSHRSTEAIVLEQKIVQRLVELRDAHPGDGYRRMTRQLQLEGFHVNRKRIARLMHVHSLSVRSARPESNPLRLRQMQQGYGAATRDVTQPTGPNQVWIADFAYVRIQSGLIYAAAIIDVWSREVVGYAASTHISSRLANIALHSAVRAHRPALGCIHRSTCGIQYLMRGYRQLLREYGLVPVTSETAGLPGLRAQLCATPAPGHQIVEMPDFAMWDEVVARTQEFIRTLYAPQRVEGILTQLLGNGSAPRGMVSGSLTANGSRESLAATPELTSGASGAR